MLLTSYLTSLSRPVKASITRRFNVEFHSTSFNSHPPLVCSSSPDSWSAQSFCLWQQFQRDVCQWSRGRKDRCFADREDHLQPLLRSNGRRREKSSRGRQY